MYAGKYQAYVDESLEVKLVQKVSDGIIIGVAWATVFLPFVYGVLLFQPVLPENRIITEILEIPLKFDWRLLPLSLPLAYTVINATDFLFFWDISSVIYFQGCVHWNHLFEPKSIQFEKGIPQFTCRLGCKLSEEELIQFYKEQKILERYFNDLFGHWLVTQHHACTIALSTIGIFISIKYPERLLEPGFQMAPLAMVCSFVLEYIETMFVVDAYERSNNLLSSWNNFARKEKGKLRNSLKYLRGFRPIQAQLAYPYFNLSKGNFLAYLNQTTDILVNLLVATK